MFCLAACHRGRSCQGEFKAQRWGRALERCESEFRRHGEPAAALSAASAALYLGRYADTLRLASPHLLGPKAADAHALVGAAKMRTSDDAGASFHLGLALTLHTATGAWAAQARDAHQLAGIAFQNGEYRLALAALDISFAGATRTGDERMKVYFEIARADLLRAVGAFRDADSTLANAVALSRDNDDRVLAHLKQGLLYLDMGRWNLARSPLRRALADEMGGNRRQGLLASIHLNLAYVDRQAKAFPSAMQHMEAARALAPDDEFSYRMNLGLILRDSGKLAEAEQEMATAEALGARGQWSWWVPYNRGQVAVERGDRDRAVELYQLAIARVGTLASHAGVWGPSLVASLRQPHLALVALYAQRGEWASVLEVVAEMDGQALLDSTLAPVDHAPEVVESPRARPAQRGTWTAAQLLAAWQGRRLVVIVPGGGTLWRLDVRGGTVRGERVGSEETLANLARDLETDASKADVGRQLETALLPEDVGAGTIDLLLIGRVARAPVSTFSRTGSLVRVLGVVPRGSVDRDSTKRVVAIGNPTGDLPASADEATNIAQRLGGTALVRDAATIGAFASTRGAALLHVAAHTEMRLEGAVIRMHDGDLPASAISEMRPAPRLVVLASCGGATGRDDAGNGSLASAFLDAGADLVVATRWSVGDEAASQLMSAFYERGGDRDPVSALAAAQRASASTLSPQDWAAFEVIAARPTAP